MQNLPDLLTGNLALILAPRALRRQLMTAFTARLAVHGAVRVLDGGNSFAAYPLARALRRATPALEAALQRVHVARAFTCYQVAALLDQSAAIPTPTLVLDLLDTFLDESVAFQERRGLLQGALRRLVELSELAPVVVSGETMPPGPSVELLEMLRATCDQVWQHTAPATERQLALF
jgi:hypothetical protein